MPLAPAPWWQRAALVALMLLFVAHATRYGDWLIDDAGITFAYARNIAAGHGPVVNVGEAPVEGYSNPSWTFVVAALYALGGFTVPLTPKLAGALFTVAGMFFAWRASRRAWGEPTSAVHLLAPALMAGVPTFVKYAMSGLENGLFVLSILFALDVHLRERDEGGRLGGVAAFLMVLGRPEGIAYAVVFGVDRVVTAMRKGDLRPLVPWVAGLVGPLALYAAWHAATFADWLPNTWYAKVADGRGVQEYLSSHDGGNRYLRGALSDHALYWALGGAALALTAPRRWLDASGLAIYGALGVALTFPLYAGGDWMPQHRLLSPMYPLLAIAAAGGLTAPLWSRFPAAVRAALPVLAIVGTAITVPPALERATTTLGMRLDVQMKTLDLYTRFADQLGLQRAVVALADLGGSSMTTSARFELVDLNGLIDRRVAHLLHAVEDDGVAPLRDYVFREKRPDFLNYPEAIFRRYQLADYAPAREDYWLVSSVDKQEPPRFGTYVRRDLLEGTLPEGAVPAPAAAGLDASTRLEAGKLTIWWAPSASFEKNPQATLQWLGADGALLRRDTIKPFGGVFGWKILQPGRVLREEWRGTVPAGAVAVDFAPPTDAVAAAPAAGVTGAAAIATPLAAPLEPGAPIPDGNFEGDGTAWTAIPHAAAGWAIVPEGDGRALRVELGATGPLVCSAWAPIPPALHVTGRFRGEGVTRGDKPWKRGGLVLRVKRADGTQHFPDLAVFEGTFDWKPAEGRYTARPDDRAYRLCVGSTGGGGTLWADDLVVTP